MILDSEALRALLDMDGLTCDRPLVLACGCFDILTVGHVRHLRAAKRLGKSLCVLVTADCHVGKGEGRPVFHEDQRAEIVDALGCVDFTIINTRPTAAEAIRTLAPNIYVKGQEYRGNAPTALLEELEALAEVGGRMEYTLTDDVHTTDIIARIYEAERDRQHWVNLD